MLCALLGYAIMEMTVFTFPLIVVPAPWSSSGGSAAALLGPAILLGTLMVTDCLFWFQSFLFHLLVMGGVRNHPFDDGYDQDFNSPEITPKPMTTNVTKNFRVPTLVLHHVSMS